jgi:hypothetical protein
MGRATSDPAARKAVLERVEKEDIEFVLVWFTDILGHLKSFALARSELELTLDDGQGFDGSSVTGFNQIEESDMVAIPDPETFQLMPWGSGGKKVGRMIADIITPDGDPYEGDPGKQFLQVPYRSKWTGTFTGTSTDYGLLIGHILDPAAPSAPMVFLDTASFTDVEVDGKVGNLEMDVLGDHPDPTADWKGTWTITSGTGELKDIQGQGIFWGPGWLPDSSSEECGDWGLIYYAGSIEFISE